MPEQVCLYMEFCSKPGDHAAYDLLPIVYEEHFRMDSRGAHRDSVWSLYDCYPVMPKDLDDVSAYYTHVHLRRGLSWFDIGDITERHLILTIQLVNTHLRVTESFPSQSVVVLGPSLGRGRTQKLA